MVGQDSALHYTTVQYTRNITLHGYQAPRVRLGERLRLTGAGAISYTACSESSTSHCYREQYTTLDRDKTNLHSVISSTHCNDSVGLLLW